MRKRLLSPLVIVLLAGCGGKPMPQPPRTEEPQQPPRVEVRVGGPRADERGRLPFIITAIHERRQLSTDAPFHVQGGEWTFFDCQTATDFKAIFTVGVWSKSSTGGVPVAWGRAVLIVKDREAGGRFVEVFRQSFPGKMPTPVAQPHVPGPLFIKTAVLGENLEREPQGGFSGQGGGWTATKWFPEQDGRPAEVYFNYNLGQRQGEFSEKDADYADDLLAVFAAALRDGPRPERTPENDPNLSSRPDSIP